MNIQKSNQFTADGLKGIFSSNTSGSYTRPTFVFEPNGNIQEFFMNTTDNAEMQNYQESYFKWTKNELLNNPDLRAGAGVRTTGNYDFDSYVIDLTPVDFFNKLVEKNNNNEQLAIREYAEIINQELNKLSDGKGNFANSVSIHVEQGIPHAHIIKTRYPVDWNKKEYNKSVPAFKVTGNAELMAKSGRLFEVDSEFKASRFAYSLHQRLNQMFNLNISYTAHAGLPEYTKISTNQAIAKAGIQQNIPQNEVQEVAQKISDKYTQQKATEITFYPDGTKQDTTPKQTQPTPQPTQTPQTPQVQLNVSKELATAIKDLNNEIIARQNLINALSTAGQLEADNQVLSIVNNQLKQQLEEEIKQRQQQIAEFKETLQNKEDLINELSTTIEDKNNFINDIKETLEIDLSTTNEETKEIIEKTLEDLKEKTDLIVEIEDEKEQLKQELESEKQNAITVKSAFEEQIENLKFDLEDKEKSLQEAVSINEKQFKEQSAIFQVLDKSGIEDKGDIVLMVNDLSFKFSNTQKNLSQSEARYDKALKEIERLEQLNNSKDKDISNLKSEIEELKNDSKKQLEKIDLLVKNQQEMQQQQMQQMQELMKQMQQMQRQPEPEQRNRRAEDKKIEITPIEDIKYFYDNLKQPENSVTLMTANVNPSIEEMDIPADFQIIRKVQDKSVALGHINDKKIDFIVLDKDYFTNNENKTDEKSTKDRVYQIVGALLRRTNDNVDIMINHDPALKMLVNSAVEKLKQLPEFKQKQITVNELKNEFSKPKEENQNNDRLKY